MIKKRCTAIVLAAGSGRRMNSATAKQFMLLEGRPILWYSLQAVEQSKIIDDCIVVTGENDISYVQQEIVERYGFHKVDAIVPGGKERFESVYHGLRYMADGGMTVQNCDGYVFIHDGARPFLTEDILVATYQGVCKYGACVAAVPVKDTIKIVDEKGFVTQTPDRRHMWAVQTPQVFEVALITRAYQKLFEQQQTYGGGISITDDAMVLESMLGFPIKLVEASYKNIKITTPEDLQIAQIFLNNGEKEEVEKK